jgi:multidrug efflux pump
VGDVTYLGQRDYSMRLWLDPQKLAAYGLNAEDVILAVQGQNIQVAAGQIGQPPTPPGQMSQYIITTLGRLENTDQFGNIVLKSNSGSLIYLKDVATIELGAQSYDQTCTLNGEASVALSIYQLPGSNALKVADAVKTRMKELRSQFPPGIDYSIVYDTTPFIEESIAEVRETLFDAIVLVALVMLVFLQNWRSALIPLVAVPVAIVGTFAAMAAFGFSLNNLTLFGLVLAIGIVVDDAIVVVEAVEHHIERGLSPRDATIRAMEQVSGPVVAIGLVLSAVFIPAAFITGIIGQFFRQFALTIAVSTLISAFNSLTLSPALSALLLRPRVKGKIEPLPWFVFAPIGAWLGHKLGLHYGKPLYAILDLHLPSTISGLVVFWVPIILGGTVAAVIGLLLNKPLNFLIIGGFRRFERAFDFSVGAYTRSVARLVRVSAVVLVVYGGLLGLTWWSFQATPTGFIPAQDKGYLLVNVQLADAAAVGRTQDAVRTIEKIARETKGVKHTVAISGQSILLNANAPNFGAIYLMLDDFENRTRAGLSSEAIAADLQERFQKEVPKAVVNIFEAPPVEGLGTAGGFKIIIQDTNDNGLSTLQRVADQVVTTGESDSSLQGLFSSFRADTPWLELVIDRAQAKDRGVSIDDVRSTLESTFGAYYINDFNRFGRTWQVNVQAKDTYRRRAENFKLLQVKNNQNQMVPLADFASIRQVRGPVLIMRYNMYQSAAVHADAGPNTSSGQAIEHLESTTKEVLPPTMRYDWTELAFLQLQTGSTAMKAFLFGVILVFLVLAAQYESWSLPLAVILVVPMCLLCSVTGVVLARMDVNIFTQIGFLVLVGLACKNAILIVEYAKAQRESGKSLYEATLAACQLRLRPIIMTSFAFILGVVPLVISQGAGAEMRRTLGIAVFAGMLGVTLFGIFLTPVFYYVIQWVKDRRTSEAAIHSDMALEALPAENGEAIFDDPSRTPDFESLRESFQRGEVVIRIEPRRGHTAKP